MSAAPPGPQADRAASALPAPAKPDGRPTPNAAATVSADARADAAPAPPPPWPWARPVGVGLANLGNTCFMNATLQALTHCPPFAAAAVAANAAPSPSSSSNPAHLLAARVAASLDPATPSPDAPRALFAALPSLSRSLVPGRQEDAHEFLRALLASVDGARRREAEVKAAGAPLPAGWRSREEAAFHGTLRSRLTCLACGHVSDTLEPVLDVALDMGHPSIEAALAAWARPETLAGVDAPACDGCRAAAAPATKQLTLTDTLPPVLTLVLKRFGGVGGTKIGGRVAFREGLELKPPILETTGAASASASASAPASAKYGLAAVVVHAGATARGGHYYAFVRGAHGAWWRADDAHVTRAAAAEVLSAEAYMLFYALGGVACVDAGVEEPAAARAFVSPFAAAARPPSASPVPLEAALAPAPPPASPWRAAGRPGLAPFATAPARGEDDDDDGTPGRGGAATTPPSSALPPPPRHLTRLTPPPPPPRTFQSASQAKRAQGGHRSRGAMLVAAASAAVAARSAGSTPASTPGSTPRTAGLASSLKKRLRPGSG